MERNQKIKSKIIIYSLIFLVIVLLLVVASLDYILGSKNNFTKTANKIVPLPAAVIGYSHFITLNDLEQDLISVRMFYENQDFSSIGFRVDFETEDGKKRLKIKEKNILNKLIEDVIIEKLAKERGIKLTAEFISQEVERNLKESGNREDVKNNLIRLYGWDIDKFQEKIVKPEIYKEKLTESILNENTKFADAQKKIEEALNELSQNKNFADIVAKYSEGESAKNGGELGWFSADQMLPQISLIAFQLKKGDVSGIIPSSLGFHIIQVEDQKIENEIPMVKVRQIFVRIPSFSDWLLEQEKDFKVIIPLKDYVWNSESQQVEFVDPELKKFENNLLENSSGDASVIF